MGVAQEGYNCIFMLRMEVPEEDMEVQEETVVPALFKKMLKMIRATKVV